MLSAERPPLGDSSNKGGLSIDALKRKLGERFRDTGVLDEVKAHLRGRFVTQMQLSLVPPGSAEDVAHSSTDACVSEETSSATLSSGPAGTMDLAEQIAHSLVAEHLMSHGFRATAGVFEPECGARKRGGLCSRGDIIMRLGVSPGSNIYNRFLSGNVPGRTSRSLLRTIVDEVSRPNPSLGVVGVAHTRATEGATQTDLSGPTPREALDETLRRLHSEHEAKLESRLFSEQATVEEQMLRFQRNCEARVRQNLEQEQEQWRTSSLEKVRSVLKGDTLFTMWFCVPSTLLESLPYKSAPGPLTLRRTLRRHPYALFSISSVACCLLVFSLSRCAPSYMHSTARLLRQHGK